MPRTLTITHSCPLSLDQISFSDKSQDYLVYIPQAGSSYTIYYIKEDQLDSLQRCLRCPMTRSESPFSYLKLGSLSKEEREALKADSYKGTALEASIKEQINAADTAHFYGSAATRSEDGAIPRSLHQAYSKYALSALQLRQLA